MNINNQRNDLFILALMTFILFALKALWAVFISSGPLIPDELLYKSNARAIFYLQKYASVRYPPAYPIVLAPAFFFKHWYEVMLVLNAFWSSLVVPATWLLARSAGVQQSKFTAVLAALLPMHFVYPNILLSENLFVPIFVLAVALALRGGKRGHIEALTFGFVLGIAHLTKYLFLPALPLLFGAWLYSRSKSPQEDPPDSFIKRCYPAILALLAYGLVVGAWLYYGRTSGFGWSKLFGFGISGIKSKDITGNSFLMWVVAYTSYIILAWLPVWGIIAIWTSQLIDKTWRIHLEPRHWRFLVLVMLLLGGYWLIAVQHSFGARYNYPIPQRLIGRYLMQLSPIMLVVGVWVLERIAESQAMFCKMKALFGVGVLAVFSSLAWWILFYNGIWRFIKPFANRESGTVDVIALVSPHFFLLALVMVLLLMTIISFKKNNIHSFLFPIITLMLACLMFDAKRMYAYQQGLHFKELATASLLINQCDKLHVYFDGPESYLKIFKRRMLFWEVKQNQFSAETVSYEKGIKFSALSYPTLLHTRVIFDIKPLRKYDINGNVYYIYRIDGLDPRLLRPKILDFGPKSVQSVISFFRHPSGADAIWFKYTSASHAAFISLDGQPLKTSLGHDGFGSALVPKNISANQLVAKMCLYDPFTNSYSDPIVFKIEPADKNLQDL